MSEYDQPGAYYRGERQSTNPQFDMQYRSFNENQLFAANRQSYGGSDWSYCGDSGLNHATYASGSQMPETGWNGAQARLQYPASLQLPPVTPRAVYTQNPSGSFADIPHNENQPRGDPINLPGNETHWQESDPSASRLDR